MPKQINLDGWAAAKCHPVRPCQKSGLERERLQSCRQKPENQPGFSRRGMAFKVSVPPQVLTERKTLPQVETPHLNVVPQFVRRSREEYTPFRDNVGAVGDAERFPNVVIGDQNPDAARL